MHTTGNASGHWEYKPGCICQRCAKSADGWKSITDPVAFVAKVREFVNHAHGEHTGEDLRGYAKDLAALLPAEGK